MKKYLLFLLLVMLCANRAEASVTYRYNDSVTTTRGDVVGGASVTVYIANTQTKASLYAGPSTSVTALSNPVTTDRYGRYYFYVVPGVYDVQISGSNVTTYTIEDVRIAAEIYDEYVDGVGILRIGASTEPDSIDVMGQFWFDDAGPSLFFNGGNGWLNLVQNPAAWNGSDALSGSPWDDLVVPVASMGTSASTKPDEVTYKGVEKVYDLANSGGKYLYLSAQLPHGYEPGTNIKPHVHFTSPDTLLSGQTVIFRIKYIKTAVYGAVPDTVNVLATCTNDTTVWASVAAGYRAGPLKHKILPNVHLIAKAATISGSGMGLSTIIYGRIERGPGDTFAGSVYPLSVDFHFQRNRLGSANEYTD